MFYGGAKGGGKSDFLLMDFPEGLRYGSKYHGILFRRTFGELEEIIERANVLYPSIGGSYMKTEKTWRFTGGSTLKLRYLDIDQDAGIYNGHQYQWIGFDELTSWPNDYCYTFLFSCLRSPDGIPCRVRGSGNPGMPGHLWVKARFIDVAPPGVVYKDPTTGQGRVFIPASLDDNPYLLHTEYENTLLNLPDHLYRAFRHGDWNVVVGQVFSEYRREKHVVRPFALEPTWFRFASMDWGYAKPFSIGWWAITHDGRMIRYKEWYGCVRNKPNEGLRLEATNVARESLSRGLSEGCKDLVMDRSCWNKQGTGMSVAEIFQRAGWNCHPSNSDRLNGLAAVHDRLQTIGYDGQPMMLIFDTCLDWIRTVPVVSSDPRKPEDVDTTAEEHIVDECKYACLSDFARRRVSREPRSRYKANERAASYSPLAWKGFDPFR